MERAFSAGILLALVLVLAPSPSSASENFSDEDVQKAIRRGVDYLMGAQEADGSWGDTRGGLDMQDNDRKIGLCGLVTYALLAEGESVQNEKIKKALKYLDQETLWTYALAMRSQAWLEAARQNPRYRRQLNKDASMLIRMARPAGNKEAGGYNYRAGTTRRSDPSNAQYGLLGVWAASRLGGEVPRGYWNTVLKYWLSIQEADGGWAYHPGKEPSSGSMTAAGVASLYVCVDALYARRFVDCGRNPDIPPIEKGLEWFQKNFPKTMTDDKLASQGHGDKYYYLFGVERIGLASGLKYFGDRDWYRTGAAWLLKEQQPDGSWRGRWGKPVATAYALLFLIRGQQPVIVNRLEYDGDWNNRPRALAGLCNWARDVFERDINWQIINLKAAPKDWHDAPLLLITGEKKPTFSDSDLDKLQTFVQQGGTLMSIAECDGREFTKGMREVYAKLFPAYELVPVGEDHPFYNVRSKTNGYPKFEIIHNGVRPLAVHTDEDLVKSWQLNLGTSRRRDFDPMANILIYLTDRKLSNRGVTTWPETPEKTPQKPTIKIARVKYAGNWNPEPLALERFRLMMANANVANVELLDPVDVSDLATCKADLVVMTGTGEANLDKKDLAAIDAYGQAGGTLFVDAARGNAAFYNSLSKKLEKDMNASIMIVPVDSPVYNHGETSVGEVGIRAPNRQTVGGRPKLEGIQINNRPAVLISRHDVTGGLLGLRVMDISGYVPDSAYKLMRNVALYAAASDGP